MSMYTLYAARYYLYVCTLDVCAASRQSERNRVQRVYGPNLDHAQQCYMYPIIIRTNDRAAAEKTAREAKGATTMRYAPTSVLYSYLMYALTCGAHASLARISYTRATQQQRADLIRGLDSRVAYCVCGALNALALTATTTTRQHHVQLAALSPHAASSSSSSSRDALASNNGHREGGPPGPPGMGMPQMPVHGASLVRQERLLQWAVKVVATPEQVETQVSECPETSAWEAQVAEALGQEQQEATGGNQESTNEAQSQNNGEEEGALPPHPPHHGMMPPPPPGGRWPGPPPPGPPGGGGDAWYHPKGRRHHGPPREQVGGEVTEATVQGEAGQTEFGLMAFFPPQYSMSGKSWVLPQSASEYNMSAGVPSGVAGPGGRWSSGNVPASASLYSMASGSSSISGVSSVSSATCSSASSTASSASFGKSRLRHPAYSSFRKNQVHSAQSIKMRIQEYQDLVQAAPVGDEHDASRENRRLPPIKEFQRDFRAGKASTRLRCAQKIVTQLESQASPPRIKITPAPPNSKTAPPTSSSSASKPSSAKSTVSSSASTSSSLSTASEAKSTASSSAASSKRPTNSGTTPKKLTVAQQVQLTKKEKEREKERAKAEKARQKEAEKNRLKEAERAEKAEKARQKEAKKLAKEEKKRAKKEAKIRRKEAEEHLLGK
ncbi:unnamed protein product [Trichogramma brassicae]|uniref:Uncharacterized protein n=1 Tax=Trichogramma brassicae TaxID=86971 RepID=A0A6H5IC99_9HYME|nr:unnamed protein product [Trichogramma brassicae]